MKPKPLTEAELREAVCAIPMGWATIKAGTVVKQGDMGWQRDYKKFYESSCVGFAAESERANYPLYIRKMQTQDKMNQQDSEIIP